MEDFIQQPLEVPQKKNSPMLLVAAGIVVLFLLALPPVAVLSMRLTQAPTSPTVSPLSDPATAGPTPQPAVAAKVYAPSDYLYLSQRYFTDAYTVSQKRQQTEDDKKEILANLQKAINTISEGISLYPTTVELWTQRANFYTAIQSIAPQAKEAALYDIQQAQNISQHNAPPPPAGGLPKGLEVVKDQQANSRDVVVAAPGEPTSPYQNTNEGSAATGTAVIPAGQTELTVQNSSVTDAAPIYVVPIRHPADQTSAVLSVVKKMSGSGFVVALDNPQTVDISFQYWVTR